MTFDEPSIRAPFVFFIEMATVSMKDGQKCIVVMEFLVTSHALRLISALPPTLARRDEN